jgi:hypothetical protein
MRRDYSGNSVLGQDGNLLLSVNWARRNRYDSMKQKCGWQDGGCCTWAHAHECNLEDRTYEFRSNGSRQNCCPFAGMRRVDSLCCRHGPKRERAPQQRLDGRRDAGRIVFHENTTRCGVRYHRFNTFLTADNRLYSCGPRGMILHTWYFPPLAARHARPQFQDRRNRFGIHILSIGPFRLSGELKTHKWFSLPMSGFLCPTNGRKLKRSGLGSNGIS